MNPRASGRHPHRVIDYGDAHLCHHRLTMAMDTTFATTA